MQGLIVRQFLFSDAPIMQEREQVFGSNKVIKLLVKLFRLQHGMILHENLSFGNSLIKITRAPDHTWTMEDECLGLSG